MHSVNDELKSALDIAIKTNEINTTRIAALKLKQDDLINELMEIKKNQNKFDKIQASVRAKVSVLFKVFCAVLASFIGICVDKFIL